jgi:hypothetical protein
MRCRLLLWSGLRIRRGDEKGGGDGRLGCRRVERGARGDEQTGRKSGVEADEVEPWFVLLRGMENDPMESDVGISPPFFFPSPSSSASPSFVDSSGVPFLRASLSLISRLNF